jgi:hypothetical protein
MPKGKLTPAQQKKAVDDAMNWLRNNGPAPANVDDPTAQTLANLAGVPIRGGMSVGNDKVAEEALNWLRNNDPNFDDVDDCTVHLFSNLAGVPLPQRPLSPEEKSKATDDAVDWLRKNNPDFDDIDEPSLLALTNLAWKRAHLTGIVRSLPRLGTKNQFRPR